MRQPSMYFLWKHRETICSRYSKDQYTSPFNSETYEEIDIRSIHYFIAP